MALAGPALDWYPAPAKLNLLLHVLGRRPDGLHELQTVFRLIDRCDRVGISVRDDGAIRFDGVFGERNLCVKAAESLKTESRTPLGCEIALEKLLPVGGGLGGGSSDAATTLLVLNRVWNLGLPRSALMEIGARLGADVPFFLLGANALGEGAGERVTALGLEPAWYLVLTPQVAVSTAEIYSDAALTRDSKRLKIPPFLSGQGRNDLESVATRRYPEIAEHLAWLRQRAARARMTGSGACVFAEFRDEQAARALERALPAAMRGFVARGLERHPLYGWIPE
jgi:4-diphosphocytidyl-2-C-methyl-D-erythritol kinase